MHGQVSALGPGIGYVKKQVSRELTLNVEVPLLHVRRRVVRQGRFVAVPLHINQGLVPSERRNDSAQTCREGIEQRGLGCNSIRLGRLPRRGKRVDEKVVGRVIPPHVYWQIKDSIPGPDDRIFVELVRNSKTWLHMVP